ncbi:MAG: bifunctional glycosyltransferase family 2/GtrA family protein [Firmicutes bacterium]|nr:bifunctional glycosyltransferase family 2/GtrA family protein [Bacillota bacterium]
MVCGFQASTGEVVAFIDADLEYPAELLPAMAELIAEDNRRCVIATRERDERPWFERQTSRMAHWVASSVLQLPVKDTQAGLKVFPGWFARDVLTQAGESGWLYDIEALMKARQHALTIVEVPVTQRSVRPRRATVGHMVACTPTLGKMAWNHWSRIAERFMTERWQLLRFGMVGAINTLVDIVVFWILMSTWPPFHNGRVAAVESLGAWIVASLCGYVLHSRVSFRTKLPALGFYIVTGLGVAVQMMMSGISSHYLGNVGALVGKVIGILAASVISYTGYHILARRTRNRLLMSKRALQSGS